MSDQPLDGFRDAFAGDSRQDDEKTTGRGGCGQVAKGCGCAAFVALAVLLAFGIWISLSWKQWAVFLGRQMAEQAIAAAPMDPADRERILAALDTLGAEFAAGRISVEEMGDVLGGLVEGPVLPMAMVIAADAKYIRPSGLPADEKAAGRRTLERAARGVATELISKDDAAEIMKPVMEPDEADADDGAESYRLKEKLSDAELREFLAAAKARLDLAGVPDEAYAVDIAGEIEKAIAKARGKQAEAVRD